MDPKTIGIVGGAGPLASVLLQQKLFRLARDDYGSWEDKDFPKLRVLSYPFSDMLRENMEKEKVQNELQDCLDELRSLKSELLAIACNTLHSFLSPTEMKSQDLIQMPSLVKLQIKREEKPLILCTSTSRRFEIYSKDFECSYPDFKTQNQIDWIIEEILRGKSVLKNLKSLIEKQNSSCIILGCTELSLYTDKLNIFGKTIVDPLSLLAKTLIQKSFGDKK